MAAAVSLCAVLAMMLALAAAQEPTWIEAYDETSNKL
jgi:hypothetical protein